MEPEVRVCLNGEVIRSIRVRHEMIDGKPTNKRQIAVEMKASSGSPSTTTNIYGTKTCLILLLSTPLFR
jgi:hypothetical protein